MKATLERSVFAIDDSERINLFVVTENVTGEHVCTTVLWSVPATDGYRRTAFERMRRWHSSIFDDGMRLLPEFAESSDIDAWNG